MKRIPYARQDIDESDINAVVDVLRSDWITQGPAVKDFEDAICRYVGSKYAVAVSSGTAALHLACICAGIGGGDEVVTTPMTFAATANSVLYCGGKPVFADIEEDTVNINPAEVVRKISEKTTALIPVHFAGHPAEMVELQDIAKKHNLVVIEDAAHAFGAEYNGSKIGSCQYSDMTVFSFHPVKHITTGEGGVVTTNSEDIYNELMLLRSHGIEKDNDKLSRCDGPWYYEQRHLGFNYRITDLQCALGKSQLKRVGQFLSRRREIASIYDEELSGIDAVELPSEREHVRSSWHLYAIRIRGGFGRRAVFERMRELGVGVQVHYIPVHFHPHYRDNYGYSEGDFKKAESYYSETMTIPMHPSMTADDIKYVIDVLKESLA